MKRNYFATRMLIQGLLAGTVVGCGQSSDAPASSRSSRTFAQEKKEKKEKKDKRPNILLIVADDMGYSDIHAFGGEIDTPNLDALVGDGRILTNHHSGTVSAIARAMLISGTDHHLVGEGTMGAPTDERKGLPGYEGYLNDRSLSVAELLQDAGYHTYIVGKWHLGSGIVGSTSSLGKTPDQWGFEHSYTLLGGAAANHFAHEPAGSKNYTEDGTYVQPGQPGQPGGSGGTPAVFYSTDFYTQKLIQQIDDHHGDGHPFFAFAAYTSPHWPLQVPEPWLSMYHDGRYDQGYDVLREARVTRMQALGIIPPWFVPSTGMPETLTQSPASANWNTPAAKYISAIHGLDDGYVDYRAGVVTKNWASLTDLEKKAQARYMEIYAGMVANLDHNIGLLIQHLKDIAEYDNTFIMFHSDNGAEGWSLGGAGDPKTIDEANAADGVYQTLGTDNGLQTAKTVKYGRRWAEVSAAPFAQFKGSQGEGGLSVPAIVHLPKQHKSMPTLIGFTHVMDEAPTFLELAGVAPPTEPAPPNIDPVTGINLNAGRVVYKNRYVYPITGISFLSSLSDKHNIFGARRPQSFAGESYGRAMIFSQDGQWKARWTEPPFGPMDGHWELFYIAIDRGERLDLSPYLPTVVDALFQQWQSYMTSVGGVEPLMPSYIFY
jgi:arylsulfatase A-like enzyme